MSSPRTTILSSLEQDLPTTHRDVLALRKASRIAHEDPLKVVQILVDALPPAARKPRRETAAGRPPLEF